MRLSRRAAAPRSRPRTAGRRFFRSRPAVRPRPQPAGIERVHQCADAGQRRVLGEAELHQQLLVGHARAAIAERRAVEPEAHRRRGAGVVLVQPHQRRLGVDEAADQPRRREAVHEQRPPRGPGAAEVAALRLAGAADHQRRRGLVGKQQPPHGRFALGQHALRFLGQCRGKEVHRGDQRAIAPQLGQHLGDGGGIGHAERRLHAVHGLDQLAVARGPVEQRAHAPRPRLVGGLGADHVGDAVDALHLFGQTVEAAAVGGRLRQHVHAFTQHARTEGFQGAQDLHAAGRIVHRQRHHQQHPAGRRRGLAHCADTTGAMPCRPRVPRLSKRPLRAFTRLSSQIRGAV